MLVFMGSKYRLSIQSRLLLKPLRHNARFERQFTLFNPDPHTIKAFPLHTLFTCIPQIHTIIMSQQKIKPDISFDHMATSSGLKNKDKPSVQLFSTELQIKPKSTLCPPHPTPANNNNKKKQNKVKHGRRLQPCMSHSSELLVLLYVLSFLNTQRPPL